MFECCHKEAEPNTDFLDQVILHELLILAKMTVRGTFWKYHNFHDLYQAQRMTLSLDKKTLVRRNLG